MKEKGNQNVWLIGRVASVVLLIFRQDLFLNDAAWKHQFHMQSQASMRESVALDTRFLQGSTNVDAVLQAM